jgi:hypothetical protein
MKLESLLAQLELIRLEADTSKDFDDREGTDLYFSKKVILTLINYVGNQKVEEAINDIPF